MGGDNRAGGTERYTASTVIRNRAGAVVGITARVGRAIEGSADLVLDLLRGGSSVLLLGRPGVGKTTAIREIARGFRARRAKRDAAAGRDRGHVERDRRRRDIPHPGIGAARRMQVPSPDSQHHVLIEAVQNHTPEVVIVDEIGTELEAQAARTISQRGVQMIATAHGHTLENLLKNPTLNDLVGGVASVTLGDDEARRRRVQKSVLEREGPRRRRGGDARDWPVARAPGCRRRRGHAAGRLRAARRDPRAGRAHWRGGRRAPAR